MEFKLMCRHLKLHDTDVQLNLIFQAIDDDDSGEVTIEELIAFAQAAGVEEDAGRSKVSTSPSSSIRHLDEVGDLVRKICARLKGASYTAGGKDWAKLFREQDKDRSGYMSYKEFWSMSCRVLKLKEKESILKAAFRTIDLDGSDQVAFDDIIAFVSDPSFRVKLGIRALGMDNWVHALMEQDKGSDGFLTWPDFYALCRRKLKPRVDDVLVRIAFRSLDFDGSGELSIGELAQFAGHDDETG
jgi:Ca2+-binding EF-hand superfamily protein